MKSIQRRFVPLQKLNPNQSSYLNFSNAIKNAHFSSASIHRWFGRLVEKNDYDLSDKRKLLAQLFLLSNPLAKPLKTTEIEGKPARRAVLA